MERFIEESFVQAGNRKDFFVVVKANASPFTGFEHFAEFLILIDVVSDIRKSEHRPCLNFNAA